MLLSLPRLSGRPRRTLGFAAALAVGLAAPLALPAASLAAGAAPVMLMAQNSRDTAQVTLRMQALEQQVRDLTGQVEGLQFQLTQLQTLLDRSNQDNDFRFKALEGGQAGAPGKTEAVEQSGSVTPPAHSPQSPGTLQPLPNEAPAPVAGTDPTAAGSDELLGVGIGDDDLGPSADPLVGKGGAGTDGEVLQLGPSRATFDNSGQQRPVNLRPTTTPANADAAAQYKAAYDALVKGNFSFAADQFQQYIKLYPREAQAADATNWLGEALLQQGDFVDAADVLVTGYKTYPDSPRAPDMLLRLGTALAGANQVEASCKTFGLLSQKYPDTTAAFKNRLEQEMAKGKCPG